MTKNYFKINFNLVLFIIFFTKSYQHENPQCYEININESFEDNWKLILIHNQNHIHNYKHWFEFYFPELFQYYPLVEKIGYEYLKNEEEFFIHLHQMALWSNTSFGYMIVSNFIYDILASCTSVVLTKLDGQNILGRNLDYYNAELNTPLEVIVRYIKGDVYLFTGVQMLGYLGLSSGFKEGSFSIALNQRLNKNIFDSVMQFIEGAKIPTHLVLDIFLHAKNYTEAVDKFIMTPITSSAYFIVAGIKPFEGVIISRDLNSVQNISKLSRENWFLVQTNTDLCDSDPDGRLTAASQNILKMDPNLISHDKLLYEVLAKFPNNNYLTILQSAYNLYTNESLIVYNYIQYFKHQCLDMKYSRVSLLQWYLRWFEFLGVCVCLISIKDFFRIQQGIFLLLILIQLKSEQKNHQMALVLSRKLKYLIKNIKNYILNYQRMDMKIILKMSNQDKTSRKKARQLTRFEVYCLHHFCR